MRFVPHRILQIVGCLLHNAAFLSFRVFLVFLSLLAGSVAAKSPQDPLHGQRILHVGKGQEFPTVAAAARKAQDGDIVEIEAGTYWRDVATWTQNKLTLRGVHGRVRLMAAGAAAEGKAIWVFRGGDFLVENIEFSGARVADKNGAGIRFEKGRLVVRNCVFSGNEMGLLTSNDRSAELEIESSEFGANDFDDARNHHHLYAGEIARLRVTSSYFHHGRAGHLLKSRAKENFIFYNRLTDELGGRASYEMEFASGGIAYVVGNIVQQSATSENPHLISFGAEGYVWPRNELYLVNNTLVDDKSRNGIFLRVAPGAQRLVAANNLLIGNGKLEDAGPGEFRTNVRAEWSDVAMAPRQDYRLKRNSSFAGKAVEPGTVNGVPLRPQAEYAHPLSTRRLAGGVLLSPGAVQEMAP